MVRVPAGWGGAFHRQAARSGPTQSWRPGWRGTGAQPIGRPPLQAYGGKVTGVPLTGGQAQGFIPAGGALTLSCGPQGTGTVWYPIQITTTTTTGSLDGATVQAWLGSQGVPATKVGSSFGGASTIALAIPSMTPGQVLIVSWTGAHVGDTAGFNVIGTMDALTTAQASS
jgi:hypothetical protein